MKSTCQVEGSMLSCELTDLSQGSDLKDLKNARSAHDS